jgi:hypothetical protein
METETVPTNPATENVIQFNVMDLTGDSKHMWDKTKTLRSKGYLAYKVVGDKGDKGEMLTEFNAEAGAIIFSPALQGG